MNKEITAEYMHDLLKRNVFSDIDPKQVAAMPSDKRLKVTLEQVDKMIGLQPCGEALAWYVSQFIAEDGDAKRENPIFEDEKTPLFDWYMEVTYIASHLYDHQPFDLEAIDPEFESWEETIKDDFVLGNLRLTDWLLTTPYRRIAAMVARIMMYVEYDRVVGHNDAIQDYYAEHCPIGDFDAQNEDEANEFTGNVIKALMEMKRHETEGHFLGLDDEQIRVVDMLWSWVPHDYPKEYIEAAKDIIKTVDKALPAETVIRSRKGFLEFYDKLIPELVKIVEKHDVPVDLTDQYNLTMGYMHDWLYAKYLGGVVLDE